MLLDLAAQGLRVSMRTALQKGQDRRRVLGRHRLSTRLATRRLLCGPRELAYPTPPRGCATAERLEMLLLAVTAASKSLRRRLSHLYTPGAPGSLNRSFVLAMITQPASAVGGQRCLQHG